MAEQRTTAIPGLTDLLLEKAAGGLCLVAPDGTVLHANREWLRSTGLTAEQVIGHDLLGLFPEAREGALGMQARARAGHRVDVPRHLQIIDGRETWWEGSIEPVPMEGGTGLILSRREVGPGEEMVEDLRQSRAKLEAALGAMTDAVFISDAQGRFVDFNEAFATFHRFPTKAACAKTLVEYPAFLDVYLPDGTLAPLDRWAVPRALRGETAVNAEYSLRRKDTGDRWTGSYSFAPIRDATGQIVGSVVVARDITAHKDAEDSLNRRDAQFRALIGELHSGVALIDASGKFTLFNRRFLEMFGLSRDADVQSVNSQDWGAWQVFDEEGHPLDLDDHPVRKAVLKRQPTRNELVAVRLPSGGDLRWMLVSAEPMLARDGTVEQVICTYHDITDRMRAEEALRRQELVVRQSRDVILFIRREDGRILDANPAAAAAYGYSRDELLRLSIYDLRADDSHALVEAQMNDAGVRGVLFESRHRRKDGSTFPVEVSSRGSTVDGTQVLISVVRDIADRIQAQQSLRESEARYRGLFENMTEEVHLWRVDRDERGQIRTWRLVDANPPTLRTWGKQIEDIRGKTTDQIFGPGATEHYLEVVRKVLDERAPASFEDFFPNLDKHFRFTTFSLGADHFVTTGADITTVKKAQQLTERANQELREADRRKDEFLGMLSHELRNPLAPIRNSAYILRSAQPGSEQARRAQEVIERQAGHLTRLVDDLLDVTRIAHGKIEVRRSQIDLRDVVARAAEDFRPLMHDRGIRFQVAIPGERCWIDADETRITQIVGNLLHNASKFTQPGDTVVLSLTAAHGRAEIRVDDTGAGIEPELLPRVFEPFVQGDRTLAPAEGGLGLGLALVKAIAELHGGTVRAESAGRGKGAQFTVRLPLLEAVEPGPAVTPQAYPARRGHRVLVVDDNVDAAESLAELVRMLGHVVEVAFDGRSAIERARANPPTAVLCDVGLPGMSGYEVAKALRGILGASAQLLAVSGYAQPEDVKRALAAGFDGHIAKPFDARQIERLLSF